MKSEFRSLKAQCGSGRRDRPSRNVIVSTFFDFDPGLPRGTGARISRCQFVPPHCQKREAPTVLPVAFQRIAEPLGFVRPFSPQIKPAAMLRKVGIKKKDGAGQRERDTQA